MCLFARQQDNSKKYTTPHSGDTTSYSGDTTPHSGDTTPDSVETTPHSGDTTLLTQGCDNSLQPVLLPHSSHSGVTKLFTL